MIKFQSLGPKLFVETVIVDERSSAYSQLKNYLRGQWVFIRGNKARFVQAINGRAVLMAKGTNEILVF